MSTPTRCTSTAPVTLWRTNGEDDFGRQSYELPVIIYMTIDNESSIKYTGRGMETAPNSVLWMEVAEIMPAKDDYVAKGDHTAFERPEDCEDSEVVTKVKITDCSSIGEIDDIMVMT